LDCPASKSKALIIFTQQPTLFANKCIAPTHYPIPK